MSEGLSDQRVALIVLGVLLLLVSVFCFLYPWLRPWAKARNEGRRLYNFWVPWRHADLDPYTSYNP